MRSVLPATRSTVDTDGLRRDQVWPVWRAVAVAVAALVLASLLDAEGLRGTAERQPFGWRRDVAIAVVTPVVELSRALRLTEPRHWLEDALDKPSTRPDGTAPRRGVAQPRPPNVAPGVTEPAASQDSTAAAPTTAPVVAPATTPAPPSVEAPLRLLVVGDSMTESVGPALLAASDRTGVIRATHTLRYSSGLTRPDYLDWPALLASLLTEQEPEVVVVLLGANDAQGIQTSAGSAAFGTEAWVSEYRARVAAVMEMLVEDGRTVYWLGQPVMRAASFDERMQLISGIYREEAELRPAVAYIETRSLLSGPDGAYSAYLPGPDGRAQLVRREDGIHLTASGADRVVPVLLAAIAGDHGIDLG